MLRLLLFLAGIFVLIASEFLKVYYIMPFPGSQEDETIRTAYMLHNNIWWFRLLGLAMIINLFIAAAAGTLVPIGLRAANLDPALSSSVVVTTMTDVLGFATFLGLATLFLRYLSIG